MRARASIWSACLTVCVAAALAGCGDDSAGTGGAGGGGGNPGSGGGTTTTTTTTTTSQGGSTGDGGGGGAGDVCNPEARTPIDLVVRNATAERLWLTWTNTDPRVVDVVGEGISPCPCDDEGACPNGGVASVSDLYGYLEPGETVTRVWSGLFYDGPAVPECSCSVGRRPPAGSLTAQAEAFAFDCVPGEGFDCDCPLAGAGPCFVSESTSPLSGQPSAMFEATFTFPDDATVEVTLDQVPQ